MNSHSARKRPSRIGNFYLTERGELFAVGFSYLWDCTVLNKCVRSLVQPCLEYEVWTSPRLEDLYHTPKALALGPCRLNPYNHVGDRKYLIQVLGFPITASRARHLTGHNHVYVRPCQNDGFNGVLGVV